jgi:hypothetical protein
VTGALATKFEYQSTAAREPRPQLAVQRGYWGWIFEVAQLVDDVLLGYTYNFQAA